MTPSRNPFHSMRFRVTAAFSAAISLLLLIAIGGILWYVRYAAERNADELLRTAAEETLRNASPDGTPEPDQIRDLANENLVLAIIGREGKRLYQSRQTPVPVPRTNTADWRVATISAGKKVFIVGKPWRAIRQAIKNQAVMLSALGGLIFLGTTFGAWAIVGNTLSPLRRLARQAQESSVADSRVRLTPPSQDAEILELVETLNGLLTRLTEEAAAKGRFYAAASHELRTPLQALSGHLELALTQQREQAQYQEALEEAHHQTRRLMTLVGDLLTLNRLDTAPLPPGESVNLADVFARTLNSYKSLAEEKQLRVQTAMAETPILAPPSHLEMLAHNLVENAIKYASVGGSVRLTLTEAQTGAELRLFNECPPLEERDMERLFEPFYRPDVSRNARTGGNGLGLAICKAIVSANGWSISLTQIAAGVLVSVAFFPAESVYAGETLTENSLSEF